MTPQNAASVPVKRSKLSWPAQLGVALIILGVLAFITTASRVTGQEVLFGWMIVMGGIIEFIHAFYTRKEEGFFLHIIPGIVGVPIGALIIGHPDGNRPVLMLLFTSFLTIVGLFRLVSAYRLKFPGWTWAAFDGIATLVLGAMLWAAGPRLGLGFPGVAIGTSFILRGWSSLMFAGSIRSLRDRSTPHAGVA